MAVCLHIGLASRLMQRPEEGAERQLVVLSPTFSSVATTDLMISGTLRRFPSLRIALSEGGIGWIPYLLDRMDYVVANQGWAGLDLGTETATELFRRHFLGCFITDASALRVRDRIGIGQIAFESDFPHNDSTWPSSPESFLSECTAAGLSDVEIEMIAWQNACNFFRFDPFTNTTKAEATVSALRALATDVDISTTSRETYRQRYLDAVGSS
jgi:predicted TIM-barrel fold metal-dependent hydrolase